MKTKNWRYLQAIRAVENAVSRITQIKAQKVQLMSQEGNLYHSEEETHLNSELDIWKLLNLLN
jgi:hypothetical protein